MRVAHAAASPLQQEFPELMVMSKIVGNRTQPPFTLHTGSSQTQTSRQYAGQGGASNVGTGRVGCRCVASALHSREFTTKEIFWTSWHD
jgi:hypothetical protein